MILSGFTAGFLMFLMIIILIEKLPINFKPFIFGHHFLSDIIVTLFAMLIMPVNGVTAMVASSAFCLLFSVYLYIRRKSAECKIISISKHGIKIRKLN